MSGKRGRPRKERYAILAGGLWKSPKIRRLSNEALGVLVRAWSYCASEMTDGRVPLELLEAWARPRRWPSIRDELTARHPAGPGSRGEPFLRIDDGAIDAVCHDFLDYNISSSEWEAKLEADRSRKRGDFPGGKSGDIPSGNPTHFQTAALDEDEDEERSSLRSDLRARRQPSDRELRGLGLAPPMRSSGSLVATWAAAYAEAYRQHTGKAWLSRRAIERIVAGNPERPHERIAEALDSLAGWLAEVPEAERDATVEAVIAGAWADPWMRERGCPLASIASDPARYLGQRSAATQEPAGDPPDWHPVTHGAPRSARNFGLWNAWSAAGCPNDPSWRPRRRAEAAS